ncbi:DUF3604 domain-containing protein [Phenylobacterium sp. VNQ135]|uniref:DUF3604 domain-containing protein n=1 Tax=Phenylobacterium sp. VNQ135 TaxID=3400922 RepID=UPI003BFEC154
MKFGKLLIAPASFIVVGGAALAVWQHGDSAAARATAARSERATAPGETYRSRIAPAQRRAFFGELHLHTTMSFDAWTNAARITPDQAYKFAQGETVMVPALQASKDLGTSVPGPAPAKRAWPLDFAAVTDHAEYLGAMTELDDPESQFSKSVTGQGLRKGGREVFAAVRATIVGHPSPFVGDLKAAEKAADGWAKEIRAANANYRPGKFTTFVGYEWTSLPDERTLHRNVIFNGDRAPAPFTSLQSQRPEDLWRYLESVRARGTDVIAIPHNSNLSDGRTFDWNTSDGRPIDEAYALARAANEPLVEMAQIKGSSETTPVLSPNDEFANFEVIDRIFSGEPGPKRPGSYVRDAWGRGLVVQSRTGANPFKMGVVGGSDIHTGLTVSDEGATPNASLQVDAKVLAAAQPEARRLITARAPGERPPGPQSMEPVQYSSAALTGVWAEENTRNAIFAALKRKETFATSGTRIRLRMFGGWGYDPKMIRETAWVAKAYATGVAMGSDLPAKPAAARAPRFILQAVKDPDGANLDRIQVVKVWLKPDGTYGEKVFDAALGGRAAVNGHSPPVGSTVDLKTGAYRNTIGAPVLTAVWTDPEFDAGAPAVYYARALEIPTPRWSTLMAIRHKLPVPTGAPSTIQERAWSSPIWFTPSGLRSASAKAVPARS